MVVGRKEVLVQLDDYLIDRLDQLADKQERAVRSYCVAAPLRSSSVSSLATPPSPSSPRSPARQSHEPSAVSARKLRSGPPRACPIRASSAGTT